MPLVSGGMLVDVSSKNKELPVDMGIMYLSGCSWGTCSMVPPTDYTKVTMLTTIGTLHTRIHARNFMRMYMLSLDSLATCLPMLVYK